MAAVLKSRQNEEQFFEVYCSDRVKYARALRPRKRMPVDNDGWLLLGNDITLEQVERIKEARRSLIPRPQQSTALLQFPKPDECDHLAMGRWLKRGNPSSIRGCDGTSLGSAM